MKEIDRAREGSREGRTYRKWDHFSVNSLTLYQPVDSCEHQTAVKTVEVMGPVGLQLQYL